MDGGKEWEELPMQTPLQGLPLVAHKGKIYRVGGLSMRNATTDDKEDIHSTDEFAEFDPASGKWTALTPLPAARSSHNAVVIGDKLYVVGGWQLTGTSKGTWQPDALVYDFSKPDAGWQKTPETSFKRRALAVGEWNGKVFALGGMNEKAKVTMDVDVFDPQTEKWSKGPALPGAGMAAFGASAWNLDGKLYVLGLRGTLFRLSEDGTKWEDAGSLEPGRFFHQLVPAPKGGLMVVGGAEQDGHVATIVRVDIKGDHVAKTDSDKQSL
jgi:N-acetylneuraminic acid mutarotase